MESLKNERPKRVKKKSFSQEFYVALSAHRDDNYEKAETLYRELIAANIDRTQCYVNLGQMFLGMGEYDKAVEAYQHATYDPNVAVEAWYDYGNALHLNGLLEEAETAYRKAIAIRPLAMALFQLGSVLQELGHSHEAISFFEQALKRDCCLVQSNLEIGNIYMGLGDKEQAEKYYRRGLQAQPGNWKFHAGLSRLSDTGESLNESSSTERYSL